MKRLSILFMAGGIFTQPSYAYNNNWVPYALGGLIAGAVIERAYNPPARTYFVQPQPLYIAAPVYEQTYAPPPTQNPYQPQSSVLYYCGSSGLYYPQTITCASNWQVLPN